MSRFFLAFEIAFKKRKIKTVENKTGSYDGICE